MHRDLSSQTGAESNSHCFVDESFKSLSTSAVVTSSNLHSEWTGGGRVEKSGIEGLGIFRRLSNCFNFIFKIVEECIWGDA